MVLNFPTLNLQVGDTYNGPNGVLYTYDGVKWVGSTNVRSTIVNGNNVIQVDQSGDLVVPNGAMIIDQDGNPIQGFQGATGPTGPRGHDGSTGVQGPIGATGVTGAQGVSVTLQGTKALIADLPLTGSAGHAWIVTESNGGDLFFWNLTDGAWNNIGKIVGPQGDPGPKGETGASGIDGATGFTGATGLRGFQGLDGATGPQGDPGATGLTGNEGATGATGPAGANALWNFRGAYDGGASYAIGDVATYGGETWYRIDANYGEGGDLPVEGAFWTKIAQKGADSNANTGNISFDAGGTAGGIYNNQGGGIFISNFSYLTAEAETAWIEIPAGNGTNALRIVQEQGNVGVIATDKVWDFGTNGVLTLPFNNYLETINTNLQVGSQGVVTIRSNAASNLTTKEWQFGTDGHFIPGSDNLQDIGSPGARIRHIYVGPGSVTIGNSVITESTTGKLVLPGVTRATTLFAEEVEDTADQIYTFGGVPFVTDAYDYSVRAGLVSAPDGYVKAEYSVDQIDGDGYIDGITVVEQGIWTQAIANINKSNSMYAYVGPDINEPFDVSNWVQIPFIVSPKANDVEYEFGGGADLGDFTIDGSTLEAESMTIKTNDADISIESDSDVFVKTSNGSRTWTFGVDGTLNLPESSNENIAIIQSTESIQVIANGKIWSFANDGNLTIPENGDILNSNGSSVLGGGGGAGDTLTHAGSGNTAAIGNNTFQINIDNDDGSNILYSLNAQGKMTLTPGEDSYTDAGVEVLGSTYTIQANTSVSLLTTNSDPNPATANTATFSIGKNGGEINLTRSGGSGWVRNWRFKTDGDLQLPVGGDIIDSNGNSVLGGGSGLTIITPEEFEVPGVTTLAFAGNGVTVDKINDVTTVTIAGGGGDNSYTPEVPEHWNEPTVNNVAAALDELAARITAIQNYEIDGGNAFTPAAAELIIDGNGA